MKHCRVTGDLGLRIALAFFVLALVQAATLARAQSSSSAGAATTPISFTQLAHAHALRGGELAPSAGEHGGDALVLRAERDARIEIATLDATSLHGDSWVVRGRWRCEAPRGAVVLETWNVLADGSRYFSRTLADAGPMRPCTGNEPWHEVVLPFTSAPTAPRPARIELAALLPAGAIVTLDAFALVDGAADSSGAFPPTLGDDGTWWSERKAGRIGGIGGTVLGVLGGVLGTVARKTRRRVVALGIAAGFIGIGAPLVLLCILAVVLSQPWYVFGVFGIGGVVLTSVGIAMFFELRARFARLELERIRAMDLAAH